MTRRAPPPTVDRAELIRRGIEAERARRCVEHSTLRTAWWCAKMRGLDYELHQFARQISAQCDRWVNAFVAHEDLFLSLHGPPGHGKTEHTGRAMPPRALALAPGRAIVYVTSKADNAIEVSMSVRSVCEALAACGAYPHLAPHPEGPWTQTIWRTVGNNRWTSIAPGMATGGIDAHGVIMDDITGSDANQRSAAVRASTRQFIRGDVLSRLRGVGPKLNMETRRGLGDATDFLREKFAALMEVHSWQHVAGRDCTDGRSPGDYLWPERFGPAWHATRPDLVPGDATWEAQHQQNPIREGGAVIREEWCGHRYNADMMAQARACTQIIIAVDGAAKTAERNDPSAIVVSGVVGGDVFVLHAESVRRDSPDTEQRIADLAAEFRATGRPVVVLIEDTSVGQAWIPALRRKGLTVIAVGVSGRGDKVARMQPYLARWASGQIKLPASAPWVAAFVGQIVSVPDCEHDDLWDAMSVLLWYLASTEARIQPARPMRLVGA